MLGLRVIYDEDRLTTGEQTAKDYLTIKSDSVYVGSEDGDLNDGFAGDSYNYLKLFRTNDKSKAATSFYLQKDDDCGSYKRRYSGVLRNDITKGAILHPDCRYLIPRIKSANNDEDETPITKIFLSNTVVSCATCTDDINGWNTINGRRYGVPPGVCVGGVCSLYLCWNKEEGV